RARGEISSDRESPFQQALRSLVVAERRLYAAEDVQHLRLDERLAVQLVGACLAAEEQVAHIRGLGIIAVGVCCFEEAEEVVTDLTCLARFQPGTVPLLSDPRRVHDARADERTRGQSGSDDCPPVPTNVLP